MVCLRYFEKWKQLFAALLANLLSVHLGVIFGWMVHNYAKSSITNTGLDRDTDRSTETFLSGVGFLRRLPFLCIFMAVGVAVFNAKFYGRKIALVASTVFFIIYSLTMVVKDNPLGVILAMIFGGSACAMHLYLVPMYILEISSKHRRGANGVIGPMLMGIGIYLGYFQTRTFMHPTAAHLVFAVLSLIGLKIIPESPVWLTKNKRHAEAKEALDWLEIDEPTTSIVPEDVPLKEESKKIPESNSKQLSLRYALGIANVLLICQAVVLLNWILAAKLLKDHSWLQGAEYVDHIFAISIIVVAYLSLSMVIDSVGRRNFLLVSCILMTIVLCIAGGLYGNYDGHGRFFYSMAIIMSTACGMGSVPSVIAVEVIPRKDISSIYSICSIVFWITVWIAAEIWEKIMLAIGVSYWCYVNAGIHVLLFIFTYFYVPETKAKALSSHNTV